MKFKDWLLENRLMIWDHTSTQFTETEGGKSYFKGKNGEKFIIQIESSKGPAGWSYSVQVHTEDGKLVGSVRFTKNGEIFKGPKHTYSTDYVHVDKNYRGQGIARAMYDYFTEQVGPIYRHEYQTPEGRQFWGKNKSSLARFPEPEQIRRGREGYPYSVEDV